MKFELKTLTTFSSTMASIQDYNNQLIATMSKLSLEDYFKAVHSRFYADQDISFMDYFIELCVQKKDQFCVHGSKLYDYGIITNTDGASTGVIAKCLKTKGLKIEVDYQLNLKVQQSESSRGPKPLNEYYLTPKAFKLCLMRSRNMQTYSEYYILLEEVYAYYTDYEREYLTNLLRGKDGTIGKLSDKIDEQSVKIDKLLNYGNAITKQNTELIQRTDHLQITADMTQEDLDKSLLYQKEILTHLVEKSYKSTIDPENPNLITHFAALMPNEKYGRTILVRGQRARIDKVFAQYSESHKPVIDTAYNANSINLAINSQKRFHALRKQYIDEYNLPIIAFNQKLKSEIDLYNKQLKRQNKTEGTCHQLRSYLLEKKALLTIKDIPITFGTTFIAYKKNPHISYRRVLQTIVDVNEETQRSPADSHTE
jgi:hypothetical protein